jgi:hypothetical protein
MASAHLVHVAIDGVIDDINLDLPRGYCAFYTRKQGGPWPLMDDLCQPSDVHVAEFTVHVVKQRS